MDPISMVLAALMAGAAGALQDVVGSAVKDAYAGLKELIARRLRDDSDAEEALERFDADPEGERAGLGERLEAAGAGGDEEILAAARALLERADPEGARAGRYDLKVAPGGIAADTIHATDSALITGGVKGSVNLTIGSPRPDRREPDADA